MRLGCGSTVARAPHGGELLGVRAKCSRCEYLRTFAEELRGTYYRCPKCREGVIAVPDEGGEWADPSDEAPGVRPALPEAHPSRRTKPVTDETPRGAFFGTGAAAASSSTGSGLAVPPPSESDERPALEETDDGPDFVAPGDPKKAVLGSAGRRPVKVRRILVECALCGYHVAVPPELFGKTVHCPECRADMMFSESSLEPVKDEILGRIALEHAERRALENPIPGPIPSPEAALRAHRRNAVIVILLLAGLAGGLVAFGWKLLAR